MKLLIGLLFALLVLLSTIFSRSCCKCETTVEDNLTTAAQGALDKDGSYAGVKAEADDFKVTLTGKVASEDAKARAGDLALAGMPAGRIDNQLIVGAVAAAAAPAAIAAVVEPAPAPVPEPAPQLISALDLQVKGEGGDLSQAALQAALGSAVGDPYSGDLIDPMRQRLAAVDGVESVDVSVEEIDGGHAILAVVTAKAKPALISQVNLVNPDGSPHQGAAAAQALGLSAGEIYNTDALQAAENRLGDLTEFETAKVTAEEIDGGVLVTAVVTPMAVAPAAPKVASVDVDAPAEIDAAAVRAAIPAAVGDDYTPDMLEGVREKLRAMDGVKEAEVDVTEVDGNYVIAARITPVDKPAPEPIPEPEPAPEVVKAPEPTPVPEPAPAASGDLDATLAGLPIYFRSGHVCVDASDMPNLRKAGRAIIDAGNKDSIVITGYSDSSGSAATIERVGYRRAAEVRNLLISMGVKRAILTTKGGGVGSGDNAEKQRRVDIRTAR